MNPQIWLEIGGIATSIIVAAFIYGQLTQRVKDTDKTVAEHSSLFLDHGKRLSAHDLHIDRLEQWKSGFTDAANVAGASATAAASRVAEAVDRRVASVAEEVLEVLEAAERRDRSRDDV